MQGVKFLSLLLVLVLANSFLNGDEGSESLLDLNPVAAAAERTQEGQGARFTTKIVFSSEFEPPAVITGGGEYNAETGLARAELNLTEDSGIRVKIESLSDGSMVYIRAPQYPDKIPEGKEWLGMRPYVAPGAESAMPAEGPEGSLRMLCAAGEVERLGSGRIRGVRVTRYRASVRMAGFAAQLRAEGHDELAADFEQLATQVPGPIRTEVAVDANEIVRRVHTTMTTLTPEGPVKADVRMDLFDFGAQPDIELPDSSLVFDMTPLIEAKTSGPGEPS
jgi:hypothetical protein